MAIIQHDTKKPNEVVNIDQANPGRLVISPFSFPDGNCSGGKIDLAQFQGGPARVYLDKDGSLSTDLCRDHYWLLAECVLPERQFEQQETGIVDEQGQPVTMIVERPLDLNNIDITVFPLPEVD
ncbi:MAG: hypothetical protein PWR10_1767 [Halanaerobiales bacterium]|nr:hypothetical protein [Halanaerobiales bacterium]